MAQTAVASSADIAQMSTVNSQQTSTAAIPKSTSGKSNSVSDGAVVGIAVGIAIGVALIASLLTFLIMNRKDRRREGSHFKDEKQAELPDYKKGPVEVKSLVTVDEYLPQPADDKTIATRTKVLFDRTDQFVQNFCKSKPSSEVKSAVSALSTFDSPHLEISLAAALPKARDARSLIKQSLARFITARISQPAAVDETLLPADLTILSGAVGANANKPGLSRCLSQWRSLTAYIRPDPESEASYVSDRDRKIGHIVQQFVAAFTPWISHEHPGSDRDLALTTILQEGASLGIFLSSQASELGFHWPEQTESEAGRMAIAPALVRYTDQHGQRLRSVQVLASARQVKV